VATRYINRIIYGCIATRQKTRRLKPRLHLPLVPAEGTEENQEFKPVLVSFVSINVILTAELFNPCLAGFVCIDAVSTAGYSVEILPLHNSRFNNSRTAAKALPRHSTGSSDNPKPAHIFAAETDFPARTIDRPFAVSPTSISRKPSAN